MNEIEYIGKIIEGYHEEGGTKIGVRDFNGISDDIDVYFGKEEIINVSYFISDKDLSKEEFLENHLLSISGGFTIGCYDAYGSEWTGYMWTEQEFKIGGHDLIKEISSHSGKYCYLKVYNIREKRNMSINNVLNK